MASFELLSHLSYWEQRHTCIPLLLISANIGKWKLQDQLVNFHSCPYGYCYVAYSQTTTQVRVFDCLSFQRNCKKLNFYEQVEPYENFFFDVDQCLFIMYTEESLRTCEIYKTNASPIDICVTDF